MAKDERQRIKDRVAEDEDLMSVLNFMERSDCKERIFEPIKANY